MHDAGRASSPIAGLYDSRRTVLSRRAMAIAGPYGYRRTTIAGLSPALADVALSGPEKSLALKGHYLFATGIAHRNGGAPLWQTKSFQG
jgi:hypothetical protein